MLLWSWNGVMDPSEVENRVREMKRKGFGGFVIQPRDGLSTKYLEDEWMRSVRRAVETARDVGLECWLHDDDRSPSGYSGGKIVADNPALAACSLVWTDNATSVAESSSIVAYTVTDGDGVVATTVEAPVNPEKVGAFYVTRMKRGLSAFNGEAYADLLNPDAAQAFIDTTHEKYSKLFRYDFGEYLPGFVTTGPTLNIAVRTEKEGDVSFPWTDDFPEFFEKLHGYSSLESLHLLLDGSPEGARFRGDFHTAVNECFLRTFLIPLSQWCREHDLLLAGTLPASGEHTKESVCGVTTSADAEYMDVPSFAVPGTDPDEPWTIKETASVANQLDKRRMRGMLFEGAGHDVTFETMKRAADRCTALGATQLCAHVSQFSIRGDRKRDYPPSISYHQAAWEHIRALTDYMARISWAAGKGECAARVLVMTPALSIHSLTCTETRDKATAIENAYRALIVELSAEHISFDTCDERILGRHGSADEDKLLVGGSAYTLVVLPESNMWLPGTIDVLSGFKGPVVIVGDGPGLIDSRTDDRMDAFSKQSNVNILPVDPPAVASYIIDTAGRDVSVTDPDGAEIRHVLVNHRIDTGAHIVFLANTDVDNGYDVTITVKALGGVVELDPLTGRAFRYASSTTSDGVTIATSLPPSGSRIFLIDQSQTLQPGTVAAFDEEDLVIEGPYNFQRLHDNVLTLDRCSLEIDGRQVLDDEPVWKAKRELWRATGIDEFICTQPWIVEKRNIRTRTNTSVLTFRFTAGDIPEKLYFAVESADRFEIAINGTNVEPTPGKWFLDKRIHVVEFSGHLTTGENVITMSTDFLWDTDIDNVYLYGDFAVMKTDAGFALHYEFENLETGDWTLQGYPFYAGSIAYKLGFDLEPQSDERYQLDLSGVKGVTRNVTLNGTEIGAVPFPPACVEITSALKDGTNTLEIEVAGSLANMIGPHRFSGGKRPDVITPAVYFDDGTPKDIYEFVPYGFIEPPKIVRLTPRATE